MARLWMVVVAGATTVVLVAVAGADLLAATQGARPGVVCGREVAAENGLWELLDELVRVPEPLRADRARRIAAALREERVRPDEGMTPEPAPVPAPPAVETPAAPVLQAPDPMPSARELADLLATYRTLSPVAKERLRALPPAEMVRAVERFARANRTLNAVLATSPGR